MIGYIANQGILLTLEENSDFYINGKEKVTILDLSSFLYDLTLLHDIVVLISLPEYQDYKFPPSFWFRNGRPIKSEHELYLNKINHNSPLGLEVIIPSIGVGSVTILWMLLQALEKIQNWKLNQKKLGLEVQKLQNEVQKQNEDKFFRDNLETLLKERDVNNKFNILIKKLEKSNFKVTQVDIVDLSKKTNEEKI